MSVLMHNDEMIAGLVPQDELIKTVEITPNISVPANGYNFCAYDKPSGYRLISVNTGLNGLSIFSQISYFGSIDRISFFNAYTQAITLSHPITLTFIKV